MILLIQIFFIAGMLMALVGYIRLIYLGFVESIIWGIVNIFIQPITGIIFCIVKRRGWGALLMMIIGTAIISAITIPTYYSEGFYFGFW